MECNYKVIIFSLTFCHSHVEGSFSVACCHDKQTLETIIKNELKRISLLIYAINYKLFMKIGGVIIA